MTQAIAYIRVSTDEQELEVQEAQVRAYCESQGLNLMHIVKEKGVSGSTTLSQRPAGKDIQQLINAGATAIVAVKLDRMFRSTIDALTQTDSWHNQGVALHIIDFKGLGSLNSLSPLGRMVFTMQAAFAEMELSQIRARTKSAMQHKKSKGEFTGQLPFGCKLNGNKVEPLPNRAEAIAFCHEKHKIGWSCRFIAACLCTDFGISTSHSTINKIIKGQII